MEMNLLTLVEQLKKEHQAFVDYVGGLSAEQFMQHPPDKWTAGQQVDHIIRSVQPLTQVFLMPIFVHGLLLGKSNRPSRSYDALVARYQEKLAEGAQATGRFVPPTVTTNQQATQGQALLQLVEKLTAQLAKYSEKDLDTLLIPHPVLGKLTIREMMYFTIHHVQHHLGITQRNIG